MAHIYLPGGFIKLEPSPPLLAVHSTPVGTVPLDQHVLPGSLKVLQDGRSPARRGCHVTVCVCEAVELRSILLRVTAIPQGAVFGGVLAPP